MRLRHVEVFYHVYREGSISAAARTLCVSQPSVSKVLRHAEDQLGFPLFDRRKGRLYPTSAADELFGEIEDIYARMSALDRTAGNIRDRRGGHIRLGALPSLGFAIVPALVSSMREADAQYSFDLATLHSDEISSGLLERRFDICVGFESELDARIRCEPINTVDLMLLAKKGAFDAQDGAVSGEMLDGVELIGLRDSGPLADRIESYLADIGVEPAVSVSAQTYYIAAELVKLGVGPAIVDSFTANRFASDDVEALSLVGSPTVPFAAMYLVENESDPLIQSCLAAMRLRFA